MNGVLLSGPSPAGAVLVVLTKTPVCVCVSGVQVTVENKVIKAPKVTAYQVTMEIKDQTVDLF